MTNSLGDSPHPTELDSAGDGTADAGLGRWPEPTVTGGEIAAWLGSIERQRATFAWKVSGLDEAGLRTTTAESSLTLGGLIAHLIRVEDDRFPRQLLGAPADRALGERTYATDWEWAAQQPADDLREAWAQAVLRSRAATVEALSHGGLDQPTHVDWPDAVPTIRRAFADVLEEYARHVGHADIIREAVDGVTGEDPPEFAPRPPWPAPSPEYLALLDY